MSGATLLQPGRTLAIRVGDGFADTHELAAPIRRRHGLRATLSVPNGFLDSGRKYNETAIEAVRPAQTERLDLSERTRLQGRRRGC